MRPLVARRFARSRLCRLFCELMRRRLMSLLIILILSFARRPRRLPLSTRVLLRLLFMTRVLLRCLILSVRLLRLMVMKILGTTCTLNLQSKNSSKSAVEEQQQERLVTLIIIGKKTVTAIGSVSGSGHESVS